MDVVDGSGNDTCPQRDDFRGAGTSYRSLQTGVRRWESQKKLVRPGGWSYSWGVDVHCSDRYIETFRSLTLSRMEDGSDWKFVRSTFYGDP